MTRKKAEFIVLPWCCLYSPSVVLDGKIRAKLSCRENNYSRKQFVDALSDKWDVAKQSVVSENNVDVLLFLWTKIQ